MGPIDFRPVEILVRVVFVTLVVAVPLAIWKAIDVVAWIFSHVSVNP